MPWRHFRTSPRSRSFILHFGLLRMEKLCRINCIVHEKNRIGDRWRFGIENYQNFNEQRPEVLVSEAERKLLQGHEATFVIEKWKVERNHFLSQLRDNRRFFGLFASHSIFGPNAEVSISNKKSYYKYSQKLWTSRFEISVSRTKLFLILIIITFSFLESCSILRFAAIQLLHSTAKHLSTVKI